jgi:hypothetical protein
MPTAATRLRSDRHGADPVATLVAGSGFAPAGELRDFSTRMMAVTIRAAIDAARYQHATDPHVDLHDCGRELANLFDRASTRSESTPTANPKETL